MRSRRDAVSPRAVEDDGAMATTPRARVA